MELDDTLPQQIPYYLTSGEREVVWKGLKAIASGGTANYFLSPYHDRFGDRILQGDGRQGFQLFSFEGLENCRSKDRISRIDSDFGGKAPESPNSESSLI